MRTPDRAPTLLRIRWWEASQDTDGPPVIKAATLCQTHRTKIVLKFPDARGCGEIGANCEFYESRRLSRA